MRLDTAKHNITNSVSCDEWAERLNAYFIDKISSFDQSNIPHLVVPAITLFPLVPLKPVPEEAVADAND